VPLAYELLREQVQHRIIDDDDLRHEAEQKIYGNKSQKEIEGMFRAVFDASDTNKNGKLESHEMRKCLQSSGIEFTDKEIESIIKAADLNLDGMIDVNEFLPVCYELMLEVAMKLLSQERS
jgi:Ca2+-binding EF-hand superfamily protein